MRRWAYERAKRAMDLAIASAAAVVTAPLLAVIALAIRLESRGPVILRQERVGWHGDDFELCKFRTMVENAHLLGAGWLVAADDPRITRVGRVLRKWSLDELPQVWNVLRGDMSIVGPRPTLRYQVEQYTADQRRRLEVRPGITGWAQVAGRNRITWPERIELDVWYVEHRSLALDLRILARTLPMLVQAGDVYNEARGDWGEVVEAPPGDAHLDESPEEAAEHDGGPREAADGLGGPDEGPDAAGATAAAPGGADAAAGSADAARG